MGNLSLILSMTHFGVLQFCIPGFGILR
jgi:hypothetical protein